MIYNDFQGEKISALGLGCMRLPVIDGDDSRPDLDKIDEMVDYALEHGINYFDTAWGYHGGNSELAIAHALKNYPRDSFKLADKFPGYDLSNMVRVREIFEKQLEKCGVDYFDFYLFHTVSDYNVEAYLDPKYGILDYLIEQKKNGRIRHLGFSAHAAMPVLKRFVEAYGEHMEFGQLQVNWLDWRMQGSREMVRYYTEHDIPVWVMEPVRGGSLAKIDEKYAEILKKLRPEATGAEWAFRFLQSIPEVKLTLSGMSNMDQLKENIAVYEQAKPLSAEELAALDGIVSDMIRESNTLPCTDCHYCTAYCPQGLPIPDIIGLYNKHKSPKDGETVQTFSERFAEDKRPTACIACRSCETVCPQQIKISEAMSNIVKMLG